MSALLSFLGSAAARWLLGEVLAVWRQREDRRSEIAMLELQHRLDAERAQWQRQAVADAAAQGVKLVEAQAVAAQAQASDAMMLEAMRQLGQPSGVRWVDGWNAAIRPGLATVSVLLLVGSAIYPEGVIITGLLGEIVAGVLGLYVGGRIQTTGR